MSPAKIVAHLPLEKLGQFAAKCSLSVHSLLICAQFPLYDMVQVHDLSLPLRLRVHGHICECNSVDLKYSLSVFWLRETQAVGYFQPDFWHPCPLGYPVAQSLWLSPFFILVTVLPPMVLKRERSMFLSLPWEAISWHWRACQLLSSFQTLHMENDWESCGYSIQGGLGLKWHPARFSFWPSWSWDCTCLRSWVTSCQL